MGFVRVHLVPVSHCPKAVPRYPSVQYSRPLDNVTETAGFESDKGYTPALLYPPRGCMAQSSCDSNTTFATIARVVARATYLDKPHTHSLP
jgi:hypothetical protein